MANQAHETDLRQIIEDAQWLKRLITEEIPNRKENIASIINEFTRIEDLEEEIAKLTETVKNQEIKLEQLEAEKLEQIDRNAELEQNVISITQLLENERSQYDTEINRLTLERDQLVDEIAALKAEIERGQQTFFNAVLAKLKGIYESLRTTFSQNSNDSSDG